MDRASAESASAALLDFHDRMLNWAAWPQRMPDLSGQGLAWPVWPVWPVWHWIASNHRCNSLLWDEEDQARRTDVAAEDIAACKRRIDRYNQQRNDAVEAMDEALLAALGTAGRVPARHARLHSETAGAMVDRLSILALKIFHMDAQVWRADAGPQHRAACAAKRDRLVVQREDLARCLDQLLIDVAAGRAYFKLYRQFKMYNDPTLNPYLYGQGRS